MSNDIKNKSLDKVADMMIGVHPESKESQRAKAEFLRRQTQAIQETAASTKKYTLYMFISVLLLLVSVVGTLIFSYLNYINNN